MLYLEPNPQSNTIQIYGYNRQRQKVADYNGLWYTGDCYQIFPSSLNLFYKARGSDESLNKPRWTDFHIYYMKTSFTLKLKLMTNLF